MQAKIAKRYAKAVFELSVDEKSKALVGEELSQIAKLCEESDELAMVFKSEAFSLDNRLAVIEGLSEKASLDKNTTTVLKVLASAKRLGQLDEVAEQLKALILNAQGGVLLKVDSKDELDSDTRKELEKKFSDTLGKKVQAQFKEDSRLVGGVRVTAEGKTYDGTLATRLNRMKEQLVGGI